MGSKGNGNQNNTQHKSATAKKVESNSSEDATKEENQEAGFNLMDILYSSSDSDDGEVKVLEYQMKVAKHVVQGCWYKE